MTHFDIEDDPAAIARAEAAADTPEPGEADWYCEHHRDDAPADSKRCYTAIGYKHSVYICHPATNIG